MYMYILYSALVEVIDTYRVYRRIVFHICSVVSFGNIVYM